MKTILVVGDPHFMKTNALETRQLHEEIEKLPNFDYIVVLGDCLDTFERIDMLCQNRCIDFLEMCLSKCQELFILVGNHDRKNQVEFLTKESSLSACRLWPRTHLVTQPLAYRDGEMRMLFVPYVFPGRFFEALGELHLQDFDMVFSHQEYHGIKLDNGPTSEIGDKYPSNAPICFNGHIHTFSENGNLVNVGTPYHKDFGDLTPKAVLKIIWDGNVNYERIPLSIREKKVIRIREEELPSLVIKENHLYKITIEGNPDTITASLAYKALLRNKNTVPTIHDTRAQISREVVNVEKVSFRTFLEERLNKKMLKLLKKVLQM